LAFKVQKKFVITAKNHQDVENRWIEAVNDVTFHAKENMCGGRTRRFSRNTIMQILFGNWEGYA